MSASYFATLGAVGVAVWEPAIVVAAAILMAALPVVWQLRRATRLLDAIQQEQFRLGNRIGSMLDWQEARLREQRGRDDADGGK